MKVGIKEMSDSVAQSRTANGGHEDRRIGACRDVSARRNTKCEEEEQQEKRNGFKGF